MPWGVARPPSVLCMTVPLQTLQMLQEQNLRLWLLFRYSEHILCRHTSNPASLHVPHAILSHVCSSIVVNRANSSAAALAECLMGTCGTWRHAVQPCSRNGLLDLAAVAVGACDHPVLWWQARNNGRVVVAGSIAMFSNAFWRGPLQQHLGTQCVTCPAARPSAHMLPWATSMHPPLSL